MSSPEFNFRCSLTLISDTITWYFRKCLLFIKSHASYISDGLVAAQWGHVSEVGASHGCLYGFFLIAKGVVIHEGISIKGGGVIGRRADRSGF